MPKFLLKRWADVQGRIVLYRRISTGKVVRDRVAAKGVGYEDHLYSFEELGPHATIIETKLMSPLDDRASKIVARLVETGGHELDEADMVWWSHFLLSLIIRTPESVKSLKATAVEMWNAPNAKIQADYDNLKKDTDPPTFEEWAATDTGDGGQRLGLKLLNSLTMNQEVAAYLRSMFWTVSTIPQHLPPLLTSDRALFMSNGLKKHGGQMILPIGPRHLFCAFHDKKYQEEVQAMPADLLVDTARKLITVRAQSHVYADNMKETDFVSKWLGYEKVASLGEQLANGWLAKQPLRPLKTSTEDQ